MSQEQSGWLLLLLLGFFLMVVGVQGSLGTTVAILFCPAYVHVDES